MRTLKNRKFWLGVAVGTIVGPVIVSRVAPQVSAKLPS